MKVLRQLIRQPLKTLTGVLLIATAVAVLCVGVGQGYAAIKTQKIFEETFTTTAITTIDYQYTEWDTENGWGDSFSRSLPDGAKAWLESLVTEHPKLIKAVSTPGLASAYIPALIPSNYTQHMGTKEAGKLGRNESILSLAANPVGMPYSCAMLEISLTEIGEINNTGTDDAPCIVRELTGTIETVIGLQEGFRDPTGYTARLTLSFPDEESASSVELVIGERYLIYGMDYYDMHWDMVSSFSHAYNNGIYLEDIGPKNWHVFTEEDWKNFDIPIPTPDTRGVCHLPLKDVWIDEGDVRRYRAISMTLKNLGQSYDGTGRQEGLTEEEYRERYTVPTIAHLEGTAEEFLASEEGLLWRKMLETMAVNNHAFPIAGVQNMAWVTAFARWKAEITQGRDFTKEELNSGAKVCIISNVLAENNGLSVGDTISPQFYNYDSHSPYQSFVEDDYNVVQPGAYFYSDDTPIVATESYTIVGIYEQDAIWQAPYAVGYYSGEEEQTYTFSPNTIFVPENSVPSDMAYGTQGFFYSLILQNGATEDVKNLEAQAGYSGLLSYNDQGYATISKGLFDYTAVAQLAFRTGIVVYIVVILLFLTLYPARETKTLMTMHSLGATRSVEIAHIFGGSFAILLPGTLLGLVGGAILWRKLTGLIPASEEVSAAYGLDLTVLLGVGAVQLLLTCALAVVLALYMSRKRTGLRKDR